MVAFSKFLAGQRGSRQLLDTDGHAYNLRKDKTLSLLSTLNLHLRPCQSMFLLLALTLSLCLWLLYTTLSRLRAGLAQPNGTRAGSKFSIEHWNHYSMVLIDPEYPRTSNMVEGFHLGFKCKVNRPKPSFQSTLELSVISRSQLTIT